MEVGFWVVELGSMRVVVGVLMCGINISQISDNTCGGLLVGVQRRGDNQGHLCVSFGCLDQLPRSSSPCHVAMRR